mmetsp:Transcript_100177/g.279108  ORF Transcript_100177/g.279108 Transcript_100177/m.279108 type:complete len:83 (-) Transcript_100177:231-479(-)
MIWCATARLSSVWHRGPVATLTARCTARTCHGMTKGTMAERRRCTLENIHSITTITTIGSVKYCPPCQDATQEKEKWFPPPL